MEHGKDKFDELLRELLTTCNFDDNEYYIAVLADGLREEYTYLLERLQHSEKERFNNDRP